MDLTNRYKFTYQQKCWLVLHYLENNTTTNCYLEGSGLLLNYINYTDKVVKKRLMVMVGILISLASFIGGIVFREIINFFKESKLEDKRFETEKKHFFAENFFPIYRDIYSAMYDVTIQIESFINRETTFRHSNVYVKDVIEITKEDYDKYMWGDDEEQVYSVNFMYHLQLLQDYTAKLRELHQKNTIMFTDKENDLIMNYYNVSTKLMWSLYKITQTGKVEEGFGEHLVQENDILENGKKEVRSIFRERFVFE